MLRRLVPLVLVLVLVPACADTSDHPASVPVTTSAPTTTTKVSVDVLSATADAADLSQVWGAASVPPIALRTTLIVGDSGMVDLAPALEASLSAAGVERVVNAAWPGFGLTRSEFAWRAEWRAAVERERPDLIVVMLGGWDLRYIDTHGVHAYARIVNEALEILMAEGARVEWLAMLPGGGTYLSPVNSVYVQVRDWSRSVDFFDAQEPLRSPDGSFGRTVPSPAGDLLVRKPDQWHFCPAGAELVAAAVHAHLTTLRWLPPAAPGWESGPWRDRADIYDNPAGACDPLPPAGA